MKKIGFTLMTVVLATLGLMSCSPTSQEAEKGEKALAEKIINKEPISQDDYSVMIDYVGEYAKKAQNYLDMEINGENNQEASDELAKLNQEYEFVKTFRDCIAATPSTELNEKNLEKVAKYAGLIEFTAPQGYTIVTNEEAAGMEEQTPDTTNGVVAGEVVTVKEVDKDSW